MADPALPEGRGHRPVGPPPLVRRRRNRRPLCGHRSADRAASPARSGPAPDRSHRSRLGHRPAPAHHPRRDQPARSGAGVPGRRGRAARPLARASDRRIRRLVVPRHRLARLSRRNGPRRREDGADDRARSGQVRRCSDVRRIRPLHRVLDGAPGRSRASAAARQRSPSARSWRWAPWSQSSGGRSSGPRGTSADGIEPPHHGDHPRLPRRGGRLLADDGLRRSARSSSRCAPPGCRCTWVPTCSALPARRPQPLPAD